MTKGEVCLYVCVTILFNEEWREVLRYLCHEMDDGWRECGCGEINLCPPDGDQRPPVYSEHHHCHHHHIHCHHNDPHHHIKMDFCSCALYDIRCGS